MKQSWELRKLGEVCDFQNGFAFKSKTYKEEGLPILRITNIQNQTLELNNLVYFNAKDYKENFERFKVFKEDLVVAMSGATTGKLGINNTDTVFYLNQRVGKFIPKKDIIKPYLYYFLSTKVEESLRIAAGAAQPNLSTEQINNFEIPLPSLPEQQRIVAILDEAFAALAKAKSNAEQNLKNAKELFESYLQGVFENKGEGWEEKTMGEVVDFFNGFAFKSKDVIETSNTQLIRMGNLYQNQLSLERRAVFYPDDFAITYKKFLLKANDLIISLTGTTDKEDYGYTVRIPENEYNLLLNQRIAKISIKNEKATNKDYLFHFLLSRTFLDKLYKTANGTRQANLSTETMKGLYITIPSIKQQQIIVQKLDALSAETKKLEAIYNQKINNLEELKKSVLQKAFSGELKTAKSLVL